MSTESRGSGLSNLKNKSGLTGLKLVSNNNSMYGPMSSKSLSASRPSSSGSSGHSAYSREARARRRARRLGRKRRTDSPEVSSRLRPTPFGMKNLLGALPSGVRKPKPKTKPKPKKLTASMLANLMASIKLKK